MILITLTADTWGKFEVQLIHHGINTTVMRSRYTGRLRNMGVDLKRFSVLKRHFCYPITATQHDDKA